MHRKNYHAKLNALLKPHKVTYDGKGSKTISEQLFELLDGIDSQLNKDRKTIAIERAERNYKQTEHLNPAKAESSTTVFRLVRELLKYL
jgi:hypothetical protein